MPDFSMEQQSQPKDNFKLNTQIANFEIDLQSRQNKEIKSLQPEQEAFQLLISSVLGEKVNFNDGQFQSLLSYPNPDINSDDDEFSNTKVKAYTRGDFAIDIRFTNLTRTFSTPMTMYNASLTITTSQIYSKVFYYIDFNNEGDRRYAKVIERPLVKDPVTWLNSDQFTQELISLKNTFTKVSIRDKYELQVEFEAKFEKLSNIAKILVTYSSIYRTSTPFSFLLSHLEDHYVELNEAQTVEIFEEIKNSRIIDIEDNPEKNIEDLEATLRPEYKKFLTSPNYDILT